jgi:hypothetical protein
MHTGVDVSHKAKGKLSALELAKKRKRERAGTIIAALLSKLDPTAQQVGRPAVLRRALLPAKLRVQHPCNTPRALSQCAPRRCLSTSRH